MQKPFVQCAMHWLLPRWANPHCLSCCPSWAALCSVGVCCPCQHCCHTWIGGFLLCFALFCSLLCFSFDEVGGVKKGPDPFESDVWDRFWTNERKLNRLSRMQCCTQSQFLEILRGKSSFKDMSVLQTALPRIVGIDLSAIRVGIQPSWWTIQTEPLSVSLQTRV